VSVTHRVAKVTAIVCGVQIPAGTIIAISPSVFNFDTEWGPTVNDFNPDRWEDISNQNLGRFLLTFLQGSWNCIGRGFAEMSIKVVLTTLMREFEFKIQYLPCEKAQIRYDRLPRLSRSSEQESGTSYSQRIYQNRVSLLHRSVHLTLFFFVGCGVPKCGDQV